MLTILMGRARTGKSDTVLRRIAGSKDQQILLVPEHASHQVSMGLVFFGGNTSQEKTTDFS